MGTVGTTLAHLAVTAAVRAVVVLTGFAATAAAAGVAWGAQDVALSMARPEGGDLVAVEGSISGVRPGAPSAPLRLTLRNAAARATTVTRVTVDSTGVRNGPAACSGDHLAVGDWAGSVTVPAGGAAVVTVPVAISADLPAECVAVAWGLAYTAY